MTDSLPPLTIARRFSAPNMSSVVQPWRILLAAVCGLMNQGQQQIIWFQIAQIGVLLKQLGKKRLLHHDDQDRVLGDGPCHESDVSLLR